MMYPFSIITPSKTKATQQDNKFKQDTADFEQHGTKFLKVKLKEAHAKASAEELDPKYTPYLEALAELLVELNQHEGLRVKIKSMYSSDYRLAFNKKNPSSSVDDYYRNENSPHINFTLSFECDDRPQLSHTYWDDTGREKPSRQFAIYHDEDGVMCISTYTRKQYIHDFKAARMGTLEAPALVMDWIVESITNQLQHDVMQAKRLRTMDEHLDKLGLKSAESAPKKPKFRLTP